MALTSALMTSNFLTIFLTLYGRMSTTGNIARLFYEEFFQTSVEYQTHITITKDTY